MKVQPHSPLKLMKALLSTSTVRRIGFYSFTNQSLPLLSKLHEHPYQSIVLGWLELSAGKGEDNIKKNTFVSIDKSSIFEYYLSSYLNT